MKHHAPTQRMILTTRRLLHTSRIAQIAVLSAFWLAGEAVVRVAGLPIPGGIAGMLIVLGLLASGRLRLASMRRGANWFLAELLLFFIPAAMAVTAHPELLGLLGLKIIGVILIGTLMVMAVTGLTVDLCYRWRVRHVRHSIR